MNSRTNQRKLIDQEEINFLYLRKILQRIFPKRNDCASADDLEEVLGELKRFSISTKIQTRLFLKKYRSQLLSIDKGILDTMHQGLYREELGEKRYLDSIRRQYWFCYPALVRIALELEFGEKYRKYANERDGT
jgi:hypothetical protein